MNRISKGTLASLLVTAVLAAPGGALASTPPVAAPADQPTSTSPAVPPAKDVKGEELATPKLTRDQAIEIARQSFTIPRELGEPQVGINQTRDMATWSLEWRTPSKQAEQMRISVGVDGITGTILSYSYWKSEPEEGLQLTLTREEARRKAEAWYERVVPAEYRDGLKPVDLPFSATYWGGATYQFNWVREINGYPLANDGVYITVDARLGEVTQYSLNRRPTVDLTLPGKILTREEAEAAYAKQVPLVLQYQRFNKRGTDEAEWRLVYRPVGELPRMNQEGILLDWSGEPQDKESAVKIRPVPASEKPYQKPAKPLEQAEALAIAQAIAGRKDAPTQSSYSEYGEEVIRKAWDFSWVTEASEETPRREQRVRIDAETGLVSELNNWTETKPFEKDEKAPVSLEQAQAKAIQFVRAHRPDLAGQVQLVVETAWWEKENPEHRPTEYYIPFQQLKNSIPMVGRDLQVVVNARTGAIQNFWYYGYDQKPDEQFPSPSGVISAEQAMKAFLQNPGIEAAWATFWSPKTGAESKPQLVWQPSARIGVQAIGAKTGAPIDYEGRDLIEAQRYPADINGHAFEREIELLWARGVLDLQDGKFNPDQTASAEDLVRWIILSRGLRPYREYDFAKGLGGGPAAEQAAKSANSAYYGAALRAGIILPEDLGLLKDLNGPVSRELFSLWAARAMGYGRIAKMEARIELPFADKGQIGAKYQNAVAILAGLGIVSADAEGNFGPQRTLTRGEAARILFAVSSR